MKFPPIDHKLTGVVVPIFSLRSQKSCGIGEFSDLPLLGDWCVKSGLELIQILPVNDTGYQESPYSALSAFALHPIFINMENIQESKPFLKEISSIRNKFESHKRVQFASVLTAKLDILKKIYNENIKSFKNDKKIEAWINKNPWVKNYALFSTLRAENQLSSWNDWKIFSNPTDDELKKLWVEKSDENFFHVWIQFHLESQLEKAVKKLDDMGVSLKGDIPILMNEDSCDVWANRSYFNLNLSAGAPPDMFSSDGQNWGFPIYNWENLKQDDYSWWRDRLKQAAKFYHAYRIDHVLGFFRIWNIPCTMQTGSVGYFNPSAYISLKDLQDMGLDESRIGWLSKAHIFETELYDRLGPEAESIIDRCLDRIGSENLFLFNDQFSSEKHMYQSEISDNAKSFLREQLRNITLIEIDEDTFSLSWTYRETRGYHSLNQWEKNRLEEISANCGTKAEKIWEKNALSLLSFMKDTTDMLVCAEDLGAVPDCLPSVLQKLGILGLKVVRWAREWNKEGQPYTPVDQYPLLSVCTPAVHDSTTLKQWWYEEQNKALLADGLGASYLEEEPTETAILSFLSFLFKSSSAICMVQIQDFFALDQSICDKDIQFERINIPGTVQDINWSYRIPQKLEDLVENNKLSKTVLSLSEARKAENLSL